ncbi:MAG: hypothetical protein G01um101413_122 [Parcubacteria group bacterium Gr01-1014_13]|nr:MAG: hypothetical protein G01um101413_122 [Parcubacteria group bacterium Gr01-1014_13]
MHEVSKPTAELLENADTLEICKMVQRYRKTLHHDAFLSLLFQLPLEVWSVKDLAADEILRYIHPEEQDKLLKMYWDSEDHKQHPLITLILLKQSYSAKI